MTARPQTDTLRLRASACARKVLVWTERRDRFLQVAECVLDGAEVLGVQRFSRGDGHLDLLAVCAHERREVGDHRRQLVETAVLAQHSWREREGEG